MASASSKIQPLGSGEQVRPVLDEDGQIVSVRNSELARTEVARASVREMTRSQSYEVLTGPLAGRQFDAFSRSLPSTPVYRSGAAVDASSLTGCDV
jgi:hypothetical protein